MAPRLLRTRSSFHDPGRIHPAPEAIPVSVAPPPVSARYQRERDYMLHIDIEGGARRQAFANHKRWWDAHLQAQAQVVAWLATSGLMGEAARTAHLAYTGQGLLRKRAEQNVAEAKARVEEAKTGLGEAILAVRGSGGALPAGGPVLAAQLEQHASELVLAEVVAGEPAVNRAWSGHAGRVDWRAALRQVEQLDTVEAEAVVGWLKAEVDPGPGPAVDPLRWVT
jgi:hypothetical protein